MAEPSLLISPENVRYIAIKAREFDAQDVETDPDSGSNASDDSTVSVLESHGDDPTYRELVSFIDGLTEDEQIDLAVLASLGRGGGTIDASLADHLVEGLSAFGCSCDELEKAHL